MSSIYIKSPLNYVGGKYKLLKEIIPLFPSDITVFVDLFGGGFNVGVNVGCKNIIYNDTCSQVVDLLQHFYKNEADVIHNNIIKTITDYGLSRSDLNGYEVYGCNSNNGLGEYNKPKYLKLREDYNNNPDWIKFYTLITCSFSNQIRFNSSKGQFNMPYGKRDYNSSLQEKLKVFVNAMHDKHIEFWNKDFRECNFFSDDFLYCDPPYYNSVATYNENGGWSEQDEKDLLHMLDVVDSHNGRFALSNNLKYENPLLDEWISEYNVHYLNGDYSNCNYQKKDKSKDIEVLITNY
ncbi:DNA adenine methylase [Enterocloster clostridioformis]|uniref:Site-specific DNA-methyltransferase (adenine-specific) n=1 Tax=Enterocloster clostridioformis TaxID=1531 RepID=A0AAP9SAE0_9FIRM|nr:DNA adenine methylase [Enterocloster clostridioformis]